MQLTVCRRHRTLFLEEKELMGLLSLLRGFSSTTLCWALWGEAGCQRCVCVCAANLNSSSGSCSFARSCHGWFGNSCCARRMRNGRAWGYKDLTGFLSAMQCTQWLCSSAILFPSLVTSLCWSLINCFPSLATLLVWPCFGVQALNNDRLLSLLGSGSSLTAWNA